jgi:hypothetical protein
MFALLLWHYSGGDIRYIDLEIKLPTLLRDFRRLRHLWHVGIGSSKHDLSGGRLVLLLRLALVAQCHLQEVEYPFLLIRWQKGIPAASLVLRGLKHPVIALLKVVRGHDGPATGVQGYRVEVVGSCTLCDVGRVGRVASFKRIGRQGGRAWKQEGVDEKAQDP